MWPDRILYPGPLTYESGARPTALRGLAILNKAWARGYKTFFMLNSTEHGIFPAHKC